MPATTTIDPVQLTARAAALRRLAGRLTECPLGGLPDRANHETWIGPTADRCRDELTVHVTAVGAAVEALIGRARALDQLAAAAARPVHGAF